MRFEYRHLLWLLLLVGPAMIAFFWWAWRVRQRLIAQFVHTRLIGNLTVGVSRKRQRLRAALLIASVLLLIVVLARPQWGYTWEEARQRGLDVVVAIDTSRSMLAADVAPNRLARAKLAALDLKRLARTDRVGLVAFAGSAFLQCPLSFDDEAFRQSVDALDVNIIPQGGSALAEAIDTARGAFKEKTDNYNVLVLFTDGEDNDGRALEAAREAAKAGIRIYTIGVGTPNGELLRITDAKGRTDYVRDEQGNVVKSRLNEPLLQDIAKATQGFFMLLTGANTMDMLYERGLAPLPKTEQSARRVRRYHERYQWFLGLAIILLVAEMFLPERQRASRAAAGAESARPPLARAAALLLLLLLPAVAFAGPGSAMKKYQAGHYESAQWEYEKILKNRPDDPRLHFNAGAAAFQGKDFESASRHFNSALLTPDLKLQQQAYYNLGNAQFRLGEKDADPKAKMEQWESAVRSYDSALKLNPADPDAKYNLDLVKKKIEELKQQQQQQQQSDQNKEDKDDEQKKDEKDQQKKDEQKQDQKQDQQKDQQQQKDEQQQKSEEEQKKQQEAEQKKKEQEQQQQQQQQQEKKEQEQAKSEEQQKKEGDEQQAKQQGSMARGIAMTPQEAQRLLDTLKSEEKAMIFVPQIRTNRNDRVLKDW